MFHGVINAYKEKGFTSHDVVAKLRGILKQKKIGHTGTLDPDAEGVLPVCLGKATKLCDLLTDKDKVYETVLLLGKTTDTQDVTGTVLEEKATDTLTEEGVREAVQSFVGAYEQIPPMYSALKVGGKKLYELAREGITVERKARPVTIHEIIIKEINLPRVRMEVSCSKGTYIRTLCNDIGEKLGTGGCMETLLRTKVERFLVKDSLKLGEIEAFAAEGRVQDVIVPIDEMFSAYRKVTVKARYEKLLYNGNALPQDVLQSGASKAGEEDTLPEDKEKYRVYDRQGTFIGLYQYEEKAQSLKLLKMFWDRNENG